MKREVEPDEVLEVELTRVERRVLRSGLVDWLGPARCTEEMAVALGFESVRDLLDVGLGLSDAIKDGKPLSRLDWLRALLATEVVFISGVLGSGPDWSTTSGVSDEDTLRALRGLQRKLLSEVGPLVGAGFGTRLSRSSEGTD